MLKVSEFSKSFSWSENWPERMKASVIVSVWTEVAPVSEAVIPEIMRFGIM